MARAPKPPAGRSLATGMLAFARSVQVTEGLFNGLAGPPDDRRHIPIEVLEKGVRGQSSEEKTKNPGKSNPQVVHAASIPQGCDSLELRFAVRVLPNAMRPHACGDKQVAAAYRHLAEGYARRGGFRHLAELYAWNLANGRFAWRNRWQADSATVRITFEDRAMAFDPFHANLRDLLEPASPAAMAEALVTGGGDDLEAFIAAFASALDGSSPAFTFTVAWIAAMLPGQEVFPSQEYVRQEEKDKKDSISRVYATLPAFFRGREIRQASMHSQKIGAALRHIDVWHGDDTQGAIAVNPYGGVQETGDVLRKPDTKNSFYDLRNKPDDLFAALEGEGAIPGSVHFVMANLVRGGVFGSGSDKKEAGEEAA